MRCLRRLLLGLGGLVLIAVIGVGVLVASIELGCHHPIPQVQSPTDTRAAMVNMPGYARPESSTFFTFPEWYIVYAADDLGNFVATQDDSGFGYFRAIAGFWRSFCGVKQFASSPPSTDVSVMIYTIGISFTVEYAIKGVYENTIGRLFEWIRGSTPTEEDRFGHRVAMDYAKFLYTLPWYQYPFATRLSELWSQTSVFGPSLLRKWERKVALSLEYAVKAAYGGLIGMGLEATGGVDVREIMFVVRGLDDSDLAAEPRIKVVRKLDGDATLVQTPRYQVFTDIAVALSRKGRVIAEIAGNHRILMTVIMPDTMRGHHDFMFEAFSMPLAAKPGWRRAGYAVPVDRLAAIIQGFDRVQIAVDHLFDY